MGGGSRVLAGVMNERRMGRERLGDGARAELVRDARRALERLIAVVVEGRA